MAIFYEHTEGDRQLLYDVANKWKVNCLLDEKSLIWEDEPIWTKDNIVRFKHIFIDNPDESTDSFDIKFEKQLEGESEEIYKLAIELMYMYYLFPYSGSISFKTKIHKLEMIASWGKINLDTSLPIFDALKDGLGATGTFYNTNRFSEISFLTLLVEELKNKRLQERQSLLNNKWRELKKIAEKIRVEVGKRVQIQHIVLHFLLPQYFERISSWNHKGRIVKAYADYITDESMTDIDEQLFIIREQLEREYPNERVDFYETANIAAKWLEQKPKKSNDIPPKTDMPNTNQPTLPSVNFNVEKIDSHLIFEHETILFDQITTAIRNGKHIILTGPPGTGKSKLASHICHMYNVQSKMVTASSNWSTYETIGGYRPDKDGHLYFDDGIFLSCIKNKETNEPENKWLIIDEINRADIDKAFGALFSALTGDDITLPFESKSGQSIVLKRQNDLDTIERDDYTYVIPNDWRIIATMNTVDKASLYEMSYAFMRRFAFIPVSIPQTITERIVEQYLTAWEMETYPSVDILTSIWKLINEYRKIGPAIIEDIAKHTEHNDDFTSAIVLYVLPQFEGLPFQMIEEFISRLINTTDALIDKSYMEAFADDFFNAGEL